MPHPSPRPHSSRPAVIRPLVPADAAAYAVLRREMLEDSPWAFAASPETDRGLDVPAVAASLGQPGYAIIGAMDAGAPDRLIGAAGVIRDRHPKMAHRARLWGVYVTPRARGGGVGGAMLEAALALARSWHGVTGVGLSVSVRSPEAKRLYERLGFIAWGIEPGALVLDGRAFDEVHMLNAWASDA